MLRYIIIIFMIFSYQAKSITIDHNQSSITIDDKQRSITINGHTYKSGIIMLGAEYTINEQELIISNHYYSRSTTSEHFVFNKNTLKLKNMSQ